ncbi:MAG: helix-turn-helix transcriptional regulator [Nitrosopumilus sp.]
MNPEIVPIHRKEFLREDGMLFVRTEGILETMVKAPLIIVGLIVVALTIPVQTSFSSTRTLELTLYSDGSTHISTQFEADPLDPDFEVNLFGPSIDNFVAVGENGFLLSSEIIGDNVTIDTFGSSSITIDYDIHDLISKEGRVWTFSLDSPIDYSLLMPQNSIIVGMNALPSNMILVNDQTQLELSSGFSEINYIFGTTNPPITNPPITNQEQPTFDISTIALILIPVAVAISGAVIMLKRKQTKSSPVIQTQLVPESTTMTKSTDPENIFSLRPDMREDDKEIVKFISENGGEALESDLRKKFLQPRTTMWRAVKRLERQGVIEISKKDLQNLVKLKTELEEEE